MEDRLSDAGAYRQAHSCADTGAIVLSLPAADLGPLSQPQLDSPLSQPQLDSDKPYFLRTLDRSVGSHPFAHSDALRRPHSSPDIHPLRATISCADITRPLCVSVVSSECSTIHDRAFIGTHDTFSQCGADQCSASYPATFGGSFHRNALTLADTRAVCCLFFS